MNPREVDRFMKEHGFAPLKDTNSGTYWTDGRNRVFVPFRFGTQRVIKNVQAEVMRIVKRREPPTPLTHRMQIELPVPTPKQPEPKKEVIMQPAKPTVAPVAPLVSPITPEADKRTFRKYDAVTRQMVWDQIKLFFTQGKSSAEITIAMRALGYKDPDGQPTSQRYVTQALNNMGLRAAVASLPASPATPSSQGRDSSMKLPPVFISILTDPSMDDAMKVKMMIKLTETL